MRANIGIRLRLAPLLVNSRRERELAHALLFALPGSPFLSYGDEIGMGDNIWLPDRDSSRTPMQWTPDWNAGFSAADPGKLYLPLVQSLVYSYTQTNVESQPAQSGSLLHWIQNVIHVRRLHPTFGPGRIRVLATDHESVLAFTREYPGSGTNLGDQPETVLCVFSFSHSPLRDPDRRPASRRHPPLRHLRRWSVPELRRGGALTLTLGAQSFSWLHCG